MPAMDALSKVASRDGTYITGCQGRTRNMYEAIQYSVDDPIATITFNRPDRLNALTGQMLAELQQAVAAAEADDRAVGIFLGFALGVVFTMDGGPFLGVLRSG